MKRRNAGVHQASMQRDAGAVLRGTGTLHKGPEAIATVSYTIRVDPSNGQASVVELDRRPPARDGELVRLTLQDGRIVNCQILDESPYCAVVGHAPIFERRRTVRR